MQSMTEQLLALGINPDTLSIVDGNETPIDISDEEISDTVSAAVGDIFSMLNATGIQSMRDDIAWGIVNSFAKACEKAERRWDEASYEVRTLLDEQDGSEIATNQLETATDKARIAESAMEMAELMRETAERTYTAYVGRCWNSLSHNRLQHSKTRTSASVDGETFLRNRQAKRNEARNVQGTPIVFSGGRPTIPAEDANTFADNLFGILDRVLSKVPEMYLVHGGDMQGVDKFAASWAQSRNVQQVIFGLKRNLGNRAGFHRNDQFLALNPLYVVALEGNGVLERLVATARSRQIAVIDRRGPLCTRPERTNQDRRAA